LTGTDFIDVREHSSVHGASVVKERPDTRLHIKSLEFVELGAIVHGGELKLLAVSGLSPLMGRILWAGRAAVLEAR
jgi:hypothetical protein